MPRLFTDLQFTPSMAELVSHSAAGQLMILTGGNNSGKSAYLKQAINDQSKLYIGVNRFYHFHHMTFYTDNKREVSDWFNNTRHTVQTQEFHNFEQSFFNCSTAIARLSNERREKLFATFRRLFGVEIGVMAEDAANEFSNRYIAVDGDSLSVTSSGTRLFLGILAALMDDRFATVAIDEPELGLSPILQRRLAEIIVKGKGKSDLLPHNPNIVLSTHSHQFLDRDRVHNNIVVSKEGSVITARRCETWQQLQDIQYRLLGNDLGELFLPDIVVFVEGETDQMYLDKILSFRFPRAKIAIQACGGDIAARLNYWASSLGDFQVSPYRSRTMVVYDSVKQAGIERVCDRLGLPSSSRVEWGGNGIEYVYPHPVLASIFHCPEEEVVARMSVDGDTVSVGDMTYKKADLCRRVCERIDASTALHPEVLAKLVTPLESILVSPP